MARQGGDTSMQQQQHQQQQEAGSTEPCGCSGDRGRTYPAGRAAVGEVPGGSPPSHICREHACNQYHLKCRVSTASTNRICAFDTSRQRCAARAPAGKQACRQQPASQPARLE